LAGWKASLALHFPRTPAFLMGIIFRPSWAYLLAIGAAVGGWFGTMVGGG
jgi:hypothetical protein